MILNYVVEILNGQDYRNAPRYLEQHLRVGELLQSAHKALHSSTLIQETGESVDTQTHTHRHTL